VTAEPLSDFLHRARLRVDEALEHYLPAPPGCPQIISEAMRYSVFAGGKRLRPVLTLAAFDAVARKAPVAQVAKSAVDLFDLALPAACAIELIHTYSLIHDDLPAMDDDELRRGRPTCHVKYGEDVAILAGDGLYAEAFRLLLTDQAGDPALLVAAARELAGATGVDGMVGGQYLDVAGVGDTPEELRRLHALKTGRLIGASVVCVLLLAGMSGQQTGAWRRYAAELGVLFQIVDDILDVTGTEAALGKPSGSDERLGKRTYVSHFGVDGARELAAESHRAARAALQDAAGGRAGDLELITDFILTRSA
jgi:geranylgeranyl diphosphate synthase type II